MTDKQKKALAKVPDCVDLDGLDGTFEHVVFRVEHVVDVFRDEGEDIYTAKEANACQKWLRMYAGMEGQP